MDTVTFKLDRGQLQKLRARAAASGRSQAAIVRDLIDRHLSGRQPSLHDRAQDLCGSVRPRRTPPPDRSKGMGATRVLVDTGPLVAYLNRRDRHHGWAVECWKALSDPLWTCEAVLSEAIFVLQLAGADPDPVLQLIERDLVRLDSTVADHRPDVFRLLRKYRDRPMSLADA